MERGSTRFRKLLAKKDIIVAPGAYDAFTARIIESLGFPVVYAGGNSTGAHLNIPEPFLSLSDMLEQANRILHVIDAPLVMDGHTGFGEGVHLYRAVREFERTGVAGIHIEDQIYPKPVDYHRPNTARGTGAAHVVPLSQALDRLKTALDARSDKDFVIIGRTDSLHAGGVSEVIDRCYAYKDLGVDMIFVAGLPTADQGRAIRKAVKTIPMMWISGVGADDLSVKEVAAMGYQFMVYSSTAQALVADVFLRAFAHVRDHGRLGLDLDHILKSRADVMRLLGMNKYWEVNDAANKRTKSKTKPKKKK